MIDCEPVWKCEHFRAKAGEQLAYGIKFQNRRIGGATADAVGKRVFEGACVSCHNWTGVSALTPYATIVGARAANDRTATNVAQIVISGTKRSTPRGVLSMPAFGDSYSDIEIAAVTNYVTARFGSEPSKMTAKDVAELRSQTSR